MAKKKLEDYKKDAEALGLNTESLTTIKALKTAIANKKAEDKPKANTATAKKQISLDDAIAEAEASLAELKAKKESEILEAKRQERANAEKNDKRPKYKHSDGLSYRFKKDCPKTLNVDGSPKELSEIIKDDELMAELVSGKNYFVEPVNL